MKNKVVMVLALAGVVILLPLAIYSDLFAADPLSPGETVTAFYAEAEQGNIENAKEYLATNVIAQYENGGTWFAPNLESAILKEGKEYNSIEPLNTNIEGKTATVEVAIKHSKGYDDRKDLILIKEDGHWKLSFN